MFAAAVRADPAVLPDGVDDSKRLPPARRERLAEAIREQAAAVSVVEVTVEAHAEAVAGAAGENATGYLDAADTNAVRFERRVGTRVDGVELRAEHGADERYVVVSAASIVAKVERDAHVATLAEEYGDVGSGYPGDQTTRDFLRGFVHEHGRLPDCARESWQTSRDVLGELDQSSLSEFD